MRLERHLRSAHHNFQYETEFINTLNNAIDYSIFFCCFCKYSSKNRRNVEEHLSEEHYEEFDKEDYNECNNSSSPDRNDSLEEMVLPENRSRLVEINKIQINERRPANDPSFKFRCARCKRRFSRKFWLKDHACIRQNNEKTYNNEEPSKKKRILTNVVNGFYRCPHLKCSQVYTNKILYDLHMEKKHTN